MKIHYEFLADKDGKRNYTDIEVSEELAIVIFDLEKDEFNNNRAETRRHESYSDMNDKSDKLTDKNADIEAVVFGNIESEKLHTAIKHLLPQQKELVYKIFFKDMKIADIARNEGVSHEAVRKRLKKIYKILEKYLI